MTNRVTAITFCILLFLSLCAAACGGQEAAPPEPPIPTTSAAPTVTAAPTTAVTPTTTPIATATAAPSATPAPTPTPHPLAGSPYALVYQARGDGSRIDILRPGEAAAPLAAGDLVGYGQPFSPDGQRMVIFAPPAAGEPDWAGAPVVLDLQTGDVQPLALPGRPTGLFWSPSGREFLYVAHGDDADQVMLHDLETGQNTSLLQMDDIWFTAGWSPDGREIAFVAVVNGRYDLYLLDVDSGQARALTDTIEVEAALVWSPVDNRLLVGVMPYDERVLREASPFLVNRLLVMDSAGENVTPLGEFDAITSPSPAWSPDGQRVAFSDGGRLCLLEIATGETVCPLDGAAPYDDFYAGFGEPFAWSPDGRRLAFRAAGFRDRSACQGVYVWAAETGRLAVVEEGSCATGRVYWIP